ETARGVERRPRTVLLVFGNAKGVFAGVAEAAAIQYAGGGADHVLHHQADCAADGGIGTPALAEQVVAVVDVEFPGDGTVDQHEHRGTAGAGRRTVITVLRVGQCLDRGRDHRHVFRFAAGHHRVDCDFLRSHRDLAV